MFSGKQLHASDSELNLLNSPREIRNCIYEYTTDSYTVPIRITGPQISWFWLTLRLNNYPLIAMQYTCTRLCEESRQTTKFSVVATELREEDFPDKGELVLSSTAKPRGLSFVLKQVRTLNLRRYEKVPYLLTWDRIYAVLAYFPALEVLKLSAIHYRTSRASYDYLLRHEFRKPETYEKIACSNAQVRIGDLTLRQAAFGFRIGYPLNELCYMVPMTALMLFKDGVKEKEFHWSKEKLIKSYIWPVHKPYRTRPELPEGTLEKIRGWKVIDPKDYDIFKD